MTTPVILIGSDATPTYNENAAPVVLDNSLALSDADAPTVGSDMGSATVTITGGFIAGDVLAADATGTAIAVSYSNGVLDPLRRGYAGGLPGGAQDHHVPIQQRQPDGFRCGCDPHH